ncbi:DUF6671 domain-containing protein [Tumidithrix helvetica PCC 7403]|uniref:DUF6671 family protein n=1 Tax=Tumidithrix helvetica TaxID=3457545 RepID=UPI003CC3B76F
MSRVFARRTAAIATMHGKERVIAPILEQAFGIQSILPQNFNTDAFGTFTREIQRMGTQIAAARRKAEAVLELTGETLSIASEGSFAPHPAFPAIACNREILLLLDRANDLEIIGEAFSTDTNFSHQSIRSWQEAEKFAQQVGFPSHGLVAIGSDRKIAKGITTLEVLREVVEQSLHDFPNEPLHLETDMRALYNPTRMLNIEKATRNLIEKMQSLCPQCDAPGYAIAEYKAGLRCRICGIPTKLTRAAIYRCQHCNFSQELLFPDGLKTADPQYCSFCNP